MSEPLSVGGLDIALNNLVQWERFAHHLPGITPTDVDIIKKDKRDDTVEQKLALYKMWLKKHPGGTWEDIVGSLYKAKHTNLAEKLEKKHKITITPPPEEPEEEIKVQKHVVNTLDKLQQSFIPLVMDVQQGINEAVKCGKMSVSQLVNRTEEERAFTIPQLQTVRTTNDYFNAIRPHYTFLNCHLLVCLALMLLDPIRAAANEYKRKVDALKNNTAVKRFKDTLQQYFPSLTGKSDTMIQVKIVLKGTWGDENLWLVEELVKKLFGLRHPDECQWFRVVPGSVMAVFLAPKHMMMSMIVSASKRRGLMTLLGVNAISVGKCLMLVRDGEMEQFDIFTSLLYDVQNGYDATKLLLKNAKSDLHVNRVIQILDQKAHLQSSLYLNSLLFDNRDTEAQFEIFKENTENVLPLLIPDFESEVSSGRLTLESLVSCINESIVCPIEGLANVRSVRELFQVIQPYYTFLNSHILQQLVLQLSGPNAHAAYEILSSVKTTKEGAELSGIIKPIENHIDASSISPNMMKVTLTLNDTWQRATMDAVEQLIQFVFYLKHPDELLWHRVRYGSVIIEFLAPKNMMMHLITNSVKQKQLMTLTGVMRLQIGNIVVHKTTQQLTLAESRAESKSLKNTKALAIYEAYVESHPSGKMNFAVDGNNNHNINESNTTGTFLMLACINSDSSLAKLLLECGADPSLHDSEGKTALMCASQLGNITQIELLLSYGANINQQRMNGFTALMMAAFVGNTRAVKFLISASADLYCTEVIQGLTAIHIAATKGHTQVVEMLLDAKVDVNICDPINKVTCLHQAVSEEKLDTVKLLLKSKANVNAQNDAGITPLYMAAKRGNLQIVDQLIRANADTEIATADLQVTPLHIASTFGFTLVVKRLLEANANKNALDKFLNTPLLCATKANETEVVKVLIEAGANFNLGSMEQELPIVIASDIGNAEVVRLLLKGGANLYSHHKDGSTSLHMACAKDHLDVVNILLKAGINPNIRRDDKATPLHEACYYGRKKIVQRLLKERVDVNVKTEMGVTPIHAATMAKQTAIVKILLKAGADPSIPNNNRMTPFHTALKLNNVELMALLGKTN